MRGEGEGEKGKGRMTENTEINIKCQSSSLIVIIKNVEQEINFFKF